MSREEHGVRAPVIGKSVPRKEGREKVTGNARYMDDLVSPACSTAPPCAAPLPADEFAGFISKRLPWANSQIVTAKDVPGQNCVALITEDQPCLADHIVNHPEEPIVLLAHPDKYLLEEARRAVRIEVDPLP